jgi:maltose O-acetyltransferase
VVRLGRFDPKLFASATNVNSMWWHWLVNGVAASPALSRSNRARLLTAAGVDVGTALVEPGCFFFGSRVSLGARAWINHRCYFDSRDRITVGDFCALAMDVMICTSTHAIGQESERAGDYYSAPVAIGAGSWIGTRAVILPGTTIGTGCVVAAGSVVTGDLAPNGLYAGAPARRVRDLDPTTSDQIGPSTGSH